MKIRLAIVNALMLGLTVTWLYPFFCILKYGSHWIQEPNMVVLLGEITLFVAVLIFGISNIVFMGKK